MSPDKGWSTFLICSAIVDEGYQNEVEIYNVYDISDSISSTAKDKLNQIKNNKVIIDDARKSVNFDNSEIDFWFIDSDHSIGFAQWYINLIKNTKYFFIHDLNASPDYHKKFRKDNDNVHSGGEAIGIL